MTVTYDDCVGSEGSLKTAFLPAGHFATGIRTCLNSGRDKVKGIQVIGLPLSCIENPSGTITIENCALTKINGIETTICGTPRFIDVPCTDTRAEASAYFECTNCVGSNNGPDSDWETVRRCPAGKVATRLTLHERDGGGSRDMYDGLRLTCNPVL